MSKLVLLYQLQQFNDQKKRLELAVQDQEIIENISLLNKKIDQDKEELTKKEAQLDNLKKEIKEEEFEDSRLSRLEKDYQEQLYSGNNSNPKELTKLQEKLDKTLQHKNKLEDELLNLMLVVEEKKKEVKNLQKKIEREEDKIVRLKKEYQNKQEELRTEIARIEQSEEEQKEKVDEKLLKKYNSLYQRKKGKVVVKLKDECCMGCRMSLPRSIIEKVQNTDEVILCEHCGRILYQN